LAKEFLSETELQVNVTVARDGERAIETIRKIERKEVERPDLILLDLNLPRLNGHEVLEFIRHSKEVSEICVVIYTGSRSPLDTKRAAENRANAYLIKPMGSSEIDEAIKRLKEILVLASRSQCPSAG
jgi:CheY-like chemotaxis protein